MIVAEDTTKKLSKDWGWLLALGIFLIILGIIALGAAFFVTIVSIWLFGWLLLIGGIVQIFHAFQVRKEDRFFLHLISGILAGFVGILIIINPAATSLAITFILALYFFVSGLFRLISSLAMRYPNWGWSFFYGIVAIALAILIWLGWPTSGLFIIGLFIGIELIIGGLSWVMLALAVRNPPTKSKAY